MRYYLVSLLTLFLLIGCSENLQKKQEEELEKEVLEIHDEVMPQMGEVARLRDELEKRKESLDSLASKQAQIIDELIAQLSEANQGMMDWMRNYSADFANMKHDEVMDYLEEQRKSVEDVHSEIGKAIEDAKHQLEKPD